MKRFFALLLLCVAFTTASAQWKPAGDNLKTEWGENLDPNNVLLASHDHELLTSTCNRVIAFQPDGTIVDRYGTYDEYLYWMDQKKQKEN